MTRELDMPEHPVHAVGIGPGDLAYVHSKARSIIEGAEVLIGFETVLECIDPLVEGDVLPCTYETEASKLTRFAERVETGETGAAALMGDPNFSGYTFLGKVERAVDRPVRVVPGISSIQIAASRSRTPLESSIVVTLHRRGDLDAEMDRLERLVGELNLLVLPRPYDYMPERIARSLLDRGIEGDLDATVYERLTFDDETVTHTTLEGLASGEPGDESAFCDLSILVVRRS